MNDSVTVSHIYVCHWPGQLNDQTKCFQGLCFYHRKLNLWINDHRLKMCLFFMVMVITSQSLHKQNHDLIDNHYPPRRYRIRFRN